MGEPTTTANGKQLILCVPEDSPADGDMYGGYYNCPVCDEPFDEETWTDKSVGGDAWGGVAVYPCPNECDGSVSVNF